MRYGNLPGATWRQRWSPKKPPLCWPSSTGAFDTTKSPLMTRCRAATDCAAVSPAPNPKTGRWNDGMAYLVRITGHGTPDPQWIRHYTLIGPKRLVSRDEARVFPTEVEAR